MTIPAHLRRNQNHYVPTPDRDEIIHDDDTGTWFIQRYKVGNTTLWNAGYHHKATKITGWGCNRTTHKKALADLHKELKHFSPLPLEIPEPCVPNVDTKDGLMF